MLSAALGLFFVLALQQEPPESFDPDRQSWSLALAGVRLEAMPKGAGLGGTDWFGGPLHGWSGVDCRSGEDEHALEIQVRSQEEFELNDLRFRLTPDGASVQVIRSSDVLFGPLQDVGGLVCVLTDGEDTVLEFEVYAVFGGYYIQPFAGAVSLQGKGRDLALEQLKRVVYPDRSPLDQLVRITGREDDSRSYGYVDQLGRRQGPWVLQQKDGSRSQVGWCDGVPHGTVLVWDEAGRLRDLTRYQFGLRDGESMDWNEEGGLRSIDSYVRDQALGRRVVFYPNGIKQLDLVNRALDRSDFLARFDALHTRPKP